MGDKVRLPTLLAHVVAAMAFGVLALGAECGPTKYASCDSNADCASRDAGVMGPVCYNRKCVQCHYDSDCDGGACSASNECESLVRVKPAPERPPGEGEKGWDYGSWDQCASDCKDPACIKVCDEKFKKGPE